MHICSSVLAQYHVLYFTEVDDRVPSYSVEMKLREERCVRLWTKLDCGPSYTNEGRVTLQKNMAGRRGPKI